MLAAEVVSGRATLGTDELQDITADPEATEPWYAVRRLINQVGYGACFWPWAMQTGASGG